MLTSQNDFHAIFQLLTERKSGRQVRSGSYQDGQKFVKTHTVVSFRTVT